MDQTSTNNQFCLEKLCGTCSLIDFETLVYEESTQIAFEIGFHEAIRQRASECDFCRWVSQKLSQSGFVNEWSQGYCFLEPGWSYSKSPNHWDDQEEGSFLTRETALRVARSKAQSILARTITTLLPSNYPPLSTSHISKSRDRTSGADIGLESLGHARLIGSPKANPHLFKYWLDICCTTHDGPCTVQASKHPDHFRVINVASRCIITAPENCKYTTLSYVWGAAKSLKLDSSNIEELSRPGALDDRKVEIPKTMLDAMTVTAGLGIDYLWIDALCIPQDDRQVKQRLMQQMHLVYSNAELTIVAASASHADEGLPGVRENSRTVAGQDVIKVKNLYLLSSLQQSGDLEEDSDLRRSPWGQRGWTFEEQIFSSRLLVFTKHQVAWRCHNANSREDVCLETPDPTQGQVIDLRYRRGDLGAHILDEPERDILQNPLLYQYVNLVDEYTRRQLTFSYDALNAFKGIESALSEETDRKFYWGLPSFAFTYALTWSPSKTARRNTAIAEERALRKGLLAHNYRIPFPSWSWAGWQSSVDDPARGINWSSHVTYFPKSYYVDPPGQTVFYRVDARDPQVLSRIYEIPLDADEDTTESVLSHEDEWSGQPRTIETPPIDEADFIDSGLLKFWTRTVDVYMNSKYQIFSDTTAEKDFVCDCSLTEMWLTLVTEMGNNVASQPDYLPFKLVTLGRNKSRFTVCLVTRNGEDGAKVRSGTCTVSEERWEKLRTEWELVTLG